MKTLSSLSPSNFVRRLSRDNLLLILDAAYRGKSYRFLRQASLTWLTSYPGDLAANLWLAKGLLAEDKPQQAQPILEKLCKLDPEFTEALEALVRVSQESSPSLANAALASSLVIETKGMVDVNQPNWTRLLRRARLLLQNGNLEEAEKMVEQVLSDEPEVVLAAVLRMQLASARNDTAAVLDLANTYRIRWPDCLHFALFQAEAQLESGDEGSAVQLLHKCVVNDAAAQVPARIWGEHFDYRPLWPDALEISFDLPIPAEVAGLLGWNLLPAGVPQTKAARPKSAGEEDEISFRVLDPLPDSSLDAFYIPEEPAYDDSDDADIFPFLEQLIAREEAQGPVHAEMPPVDIKTIETEEAGETVEHISPFIMEGPVRAEMPEEVIPQPQFAVSETLRSVQDEFERMAKRLKMPGLGRADGRYPVYVILSTEEGLKNQYGYGTLAVLDKEMHRLAACLCKRPGWDALVYYPDSEACVSKLGLKTVDPADPWKLKLALHDLDAALGKKGEMIGALLIVGGPEVVPFHHLPNPTDDMDSQIASDNPYATLDSNYFIQDWPVGRLPGETGPDAGLLLEGLRRLIRYHSQYASANAKPKPLDFWQRVQVFLLGRAKRKHNGSFGYTAAVWKRSSLAVYRTIGEANSLIASPPQATGSLPGRKPVSMAYYNLHGLVDAAEWYGQRDVADNTPGPDYPIALSPKDLTGKGRSPEIIFSEACYGAHITGKTEEQSMALKFLAQGTLILVGSTCASYGSITTPLIGADLLGNYFWKNVKLGSTVGEALLQARVDLVREMNKRQGFLDAEDQKTLISFVLYGDPLISADNSDGKQHKTVLRSRAHPAIKTMTDQKEDGAPAQPVPAEVVKQVKGIVAEYLPGLENAELRVRKQVSSNGKKPSEQAKTTTENGRTVVTIDKQVQIGPKLHHQVARVTLDSKGKMLKLALSR